MPASIINDNNFQEFIEPVVNGDKKKHGLNPRNFKTHPPGHFAWAPVFPQEFLIPESEWPDRIAQMAADKATLFDLRQRHPEALSSLDQDGFGYCLPAGQEVRLISGDHLAIEDVPEGAIVLTAEGNKGRVTKTLQRSYNGDLVELGFGLSAQLRATPEHPILTRSGYKPIGELVYEEAVIMTDGGLVWMEPIREIVRKPFSGTVYNLEVEGDNSYVCERVGVHNCWAFSSTKAIMYTRARANEPLVRLSAWAVASIIKNYQDEGGWGAESLEWIVQNGVPSMEFWPQGAGGRGAQKYDTPAMRASAALHKATLFYDGTDDRSQNRKIMYSAFFHGMVPILDFNWWSHSVCGCRALSPTDIDIDNSWTNNAGNNGIFTLQGSKSIPDNIVVAYASLPSME